MLTDRTVSCWGADQDGELGNGTVVLAATPTPTLVPNLTGVTSLASGAGNVYAVLQDGTIRAWGANQCGALGDGTNTDATAPVLVQMVDHVTAVSAGLCHACALLENGTVECWGSTGEGLLGSARTTSTPLPIQW